MALRVVEEASLTNSENNPDNIMVVIESDQGDPDFNLAIDELQGVQAKQEAIRYATRIGIVPCACKPHGPGAYPVNHEGLPLHDVRDENGQSLPPQHPRMQVNRYRIDIPIGLRVI